MINVNSLIRGNIVSGAQSLNNISPIDGSVISKVNLLTEHELTDVFRKAMPESGNEVKKDFSELIKLAQFFRENRLRLIKQIMADSGFIKNDVEDLIDGSIEFCESYEEHLEQLSVSDLTTSFSFTKDSDQKIIFTSLPYGLIAATTPRNTPLITEITIIVHAIWSGNSIVLRPSPGVAGTVSLLIEGLMECFQKDTLEKLNIVFSNAKEFVQASLTYSNLLHYVGSSKYLENTLIAGIEKGVKVLVDGDGCSSVIVDSSVNIEETVRICYQGLIRCNAQICISIRVIIVEEKIYEEFKEQFINLIKKTKIAPPSLDSDADMGPLFSDAQVENIFSVAKKYKLLYGKTNPLKYGSNYVLPSVVELDSLDNKFLRESVFGPIIGIASYSEDGWKRWLKENPISLTDVVFSKNEKFINEFLNVSKSPRKIVNLDPTIESVFEPWGAFLPSGWNDVSYWYSKYRNYFQVVRK